MLIDAHAHLNLEAFENDWKEVIEEALKAGIWIIIVGNDLKTSKKAIEIAENYKEGVYAAIGLHPGNVSYTAPTPTEEVPKDREKEIFDIRNYRKLVRHPKVVALGEVGLDWHHLPESRWADPKIEHASLIKEYQRKVLKEFIELSREFRLPLILHCREAHDELIKILYGWDLKSKGFDTRGIIHNFDGNWEQAVRYLNADFLISFAGLITHAHFSGETIIKTPLSKIVLETNSPYMTPEPIRIDRNKPIYLEYIARELARIKKVSYDEICTVTTENVLRIFPKIHLKLPKAKSFSRKKK